MRLFDRDVTYVKRWKEFIGQTLSHTVAEDFAVTVSKKGWEGD